jgi:hypothetical protein
MSPQETQKGLYNATEQLVAQLKQLNSYYANQAQPDTTSRLQSQLEGVNRLQANMRPVDTMAALRDVGGNRAGGSSFEDGLYGTGSGIYIPGSSTYAREQLASFFSPQQEEPSPGFFRKTLVKAGIISPDASTPGAGGNASPMSTIPGVSQDDYGTAIKERIKIPQFGDWQIDDKLQYVRDQATRVANANGYYQTPEQQAASGVTPSTLGSTAAKVAQAAQFGYNNAATLHFLGTGLDKIASFGEANQSFGANLGYNPVSGGLGPSTILGFHNPLALIPGIGTSAATQGFNAQMQELALRTNAGISGPASKQIIESLAGQGFSGGAMDQLAQRLAVPLVQQGMSPEVASQFANATRNGDTSIQQLANSLKNMGQLAIETRESIDQYGESLLSFMQTAEEYGSTQGQAAATGTQFSTITGLDPQILGQAYSNPLYQGVMMSQYGLLPSGLATADTGTQTQGLLSTLKMAMGATGGLDSPVYRMVDGVRVEVQTGYERQIAQAAQLAGVSPAIAERLLRNQGKITAQSAVSSLLNSPGGWEAEMNKMRFGHGSHFLPTENERKLLQSGAPDSESGDSWVSWDRIAKEAAKAGVSQKTLNAIAKDPLNVRAKDLNTALRKAGQQQVKDTGSSVTVKFTGMAERFFQQASASGAANSGMGPLTSNFAGDPALMALVGKS